MQTKNNRVKRSRLRKLIDCATVGVALLASSTTWALPPSQHAVRRTIESIDRNAHTLTLLSPNGSNPLDFVWKDSTRFVLGASRICSGALEPGQPVKLYYRREFGQLVPREVSLRTDAPKGCKTGECCGKGS